MAFVMNMRTFYGLATILMSITFLGNIWNMSIIWGGMNWGGRISFIAGSLLFNLLLASLFLYLWKSTPKMKIKEAPELDRVMQELQSKQDTPQKRAVKYPLKLSIKQSPASL